MNKIHCIDCDLPLANRPVKVTPLIYLQATILFNIGSIWSQIGAKQVRNKKQIRNELNECM